MTKHAVFTRTTLIAALFVSLFVMGSCTKHVTQVVDQGFSAIYTIHSTDWKPDTFTNPVINQDAVVLNVPEIDQQIVDHGGVAVYLSFDGGDSYDALPEEVNGITYNTMHWLSKLYIGFRTVNGSQPTIPTTDIVAKVVILDATPLPN